jgi:RsiW-degrading membrane proteinase PrsW (M82 family)
MRTQRLKRFGLACVPAFFIAFAVAFVFIIVDVFLLTPPGAVAWHDGNGSPVPPHQGEPIYAQPRLVGAPMAFVIAAAFLGALAAFLMAGWPESGGRQKVP